MNSKIYYLLLLLFCMISLSAKAQELTTASAKSVFKSIDENQNFIGLIDIDAIKNLPIGLKRTIHNVEYIIAVSKLTYYPSYTEFTLFMRITTPYENGKDNCLYLAAKDVKILSNGSFAQDIKLYLLDDYIIPIGKAGELVLKADKTHAIIDCMGFKELSINADIVFSNKIIVPAGNKSSNARVTSNFSMVVSNLDDIVSEINIPDFEIAGLEDWIFSAKKCVLDFSNSRHQEFVVLPDTYKELFSPDTKNTWKGVYFQELSVTLPAAFEKKNSKERFSIKTKNVIIDANGFTGNITATNIIPSKTGCTGNWDFSMDSLHIIFEKSKLLSGRFKGKIALPVDITSLEYQGTFDQNNHYELLTKLKDSMNFNMFGKASATIHSDSYINLTIENNKFVAEASLNGKMKLLVSKDRSDIAHIPEIGFRELKIRNKQPYFEIKQWFYDQQIAVAGFPASIDFIGLETVSDDKIKLNIGASIALSSAADGGIKGKTAFDIIAKLEQQNGSQCWEFNGIDMKSIAVTYATTTFKIDGTINIFEDHELYGTGFAGSVKMEIKPIEIKVDASAMFGKTSTFKYWFCDAKANFGSNGIPIYPGLVLNSFGGGAFQKMRIVEGVKPDEKILGLKFSGVKYVPDSTVNLGIKAIAGIACQANTSIFNGDLTLEVAFNNNNGLKYLMLEGAASMLNPIPNDYLEKAGEKLAYLGNTNSKAIQAQQRKAMAQKSQFTADAKIIMDFQNNTLSGQFATYLNAGILKGSGSDNCAGIIDLYIDKRKWYLHAGTPDNRMGVTMQVGFLKLNTGCYLMAGHDIPEIPPLKPEVQKLFPNSTNNTLQQQRNTQSITSGKGLAFGADLSIQTGDLTFLIFYANFNTGIGFDVTLKQYSNATCFGSSESIGINGWYAQGQSYAYVSGTMGLTAKVLGKQRKIEFFNASAGILMQAQLPNPFWFSGEVASNYNLLGGIIKGNCNFKFEIGDHCDIQETKKTFNAAGIIADIYPHNNASDIDVFACPTVAFNMPIKEIKLDSNSYVMPKLEQFELSKNGKIINGNLKWNAIKKLLTLETTDILPPKSKLKVFVKLSFTEKTSEGWKPVITETGEAPKTIRMDNIESTYPVVSQQNYFNNESDNGFIILKKNQSNIFENPVKAAFISTGDTLFASANYDLNTRKIFWQNPILKHGETYKLELITYNQGQNSAETQGVYQTSFSSDNNNLEEYKEKITEVSSFSGSTSIISYVFRCSKFSTLLEKLNAIQFTNYIRTPEINVFSTKMELIQNLYYLQAHINPIEAFDETELNGSPFTYNKPLVNVEADLNNNEYFRLHIYPLIYANYSFNGLITLERAAGQSIQPTWGIYKNLFYRMQDNDEHFPWVYKAPLIFDKDLNTIQCQLAMLAAKGVTLGKYANLLTAHLPIMTTGDYPMRISYQLPNSIAGTQTTIILKNPIK